MKDVLEKFELMLLRKYPAFIKSFNAGMPRDEIHLFLTKKGLNLSEHVKDLYSWKNGIKTKEEDNILKNWLFRNGIFYPINEAFLNYEACSIKAGVWSEDFFPLFGSGYGDFILIKQITSRNYDEHLYFYSPALLVIEPLTIYDNLTVLINSLIDAYEIDVIKRDIENNISLEDIDAYFDFMRKGHSVSKYWKIE